LLLWRWIRFVDINELQNAFESGLLVFFRLLREVVVRDGLELIRDWFCLLNSDRLLEGCLNFFLLLAFKFLLLLFQLPFRESYDFLDVGQQ